MIILVLFACDGGDSTPTDSAALQPTLTNVQAEVFDLSCTFSTCHGASGSAGELDLTPGQSFGEMVNVAAVGPLELDTASTELLVIPGDLENSYLMKKLRGDDGIYKKRMPSSGGGLDAERMKLVEDWVLAGALDN